MLRVIRHYLPIRKALLILSETLLLSLVLVAGMTFHLWDPSVNVLDAITIENMNVETATLRCAISAILLAIVSQIAIAFNELYDFRISSSQYARSARFMESTGSALGITLLAVVLVHSWQLERVLDFPGLSLMQRVQMIVFSLLPGFTLLYFWRNLFHYLMRRFSFDERVLILGSGKAAHALAREILERGESGYEIAGLLPAETPDGDPGSTGDRRGGGPRAADRSRTADVTASSGVIPSEVLDFGSRETAATLNLVLEPASLVAEPSVKEAKSGQILTGASNGNGSGTPDQHTELFELVQRLGVDVVAVALQDRRNSLPTGELLRCRLAGISVREQEAMYEEITGKIAVEALRPSYLIFNEGFSYHPWAELLKRTVDVLSALVILLLTWPLMIAAAIAIRFDSPGPILFSQERVGRDGRPFTLFKFRSMRQDAEKHSGPVWASEDDPRITRCGRFLRRSRIDELPQLFNVLAGSMSLVGPRPEREHFVSDLTARIPYFSQRHVVKPGVTGWAQINYPYGNTFEDSLQKLQYDLFYIKNQSLLFDLSILFNTIKTVVLRKGT